MALQIFHATETCLDLQRGENYSIWLHLNGLVHRVKKAFPVTETCLNKLQTTSNTVETALSDVWSTDTDFHQFKQLARTSQDLLMGENHTTDVSQHWNLAVWASQDLDTVKITSLDHLSTKTGLHELHEERSVKRFSPMCGCCEAQANLF